MLTSSVPQGAGSLGSPLSVLAPVAAASTHLCATVVRSFFVLVTLGYFWLPITLLLLSRAGRAPGLRAPAGQGLRLCSPQRVPGGRGGSTDDSRFLPCSFFSQQLRSGGALLSLRVFECFP